MAESDEETVEVGMNEELRLCGMAGDDEEENMAEDLDALFGGGGGASDGTAANPIGVDGDGAGDGSAPLPDGNNVKRPRPSTSPVWADYEKLFKTINGKTVRYGARCLHCSKVYSGLSSGGTGHLSRYILVCVKKREKSRMS